MLIVKVQSTLSWVVLILVSSAHGHSGHGGGFGGHGEGFGWGPNGANFGGLFPGVPGRGPGGGGGGGFGGGGGGFGWGPGGAGFGGGGGGGFGGGGLSFPGAGFRPSMGIKPFPQTKPNPIPGPWFGVNPFRPSSPSLLGALKPMLKPMEKPFLIIEPPMPEPFLIIDPPMPEPVMIIDPPMPEGPDMTMVGQSGGPMGPGGPMGGMGPGGPMGGMGPGRPMGGMGPGRPMGAIGSGGSVNPPTAGGISPEKPADDTVRGAVNSVRSQLAEKLGLSANAQIVPVFYTSQVVAGHLFRVKIRIGAGLDEQYVHATIVNQPWKNPQYELTNLQTGKSLKDPLTS